MDTNTETTEATETTEEQTPPPRSFRHRGERAEAAAGAATGAAGAAAGSSLVLGPRDVLEGKLTVDGDIRIQGTASGELKAGGDVTVDANSNLTASVEARNVNVRGNVTGDVTAREKLLVAGSGVVSGNVKVARLAIEDGATLNGNVQMQAAGHRSSEG